MPRKQSPSHMPSPSKTVLSFIGSTDTYGLSAFSSFISIGRLFSAPGDLAVLKRLRRHFYPLHPGPLFPLLSTQEFLSFLNHASNAVIPAFARQSYRPQSVYRNTSRAKSEYFFCSCVQIITHGGQKSLWTLPLHAACYKSLKVHAQEYEYWVRQGPMPQS